MLTIKVGNATIRKAVMLGAPMLAETSNPSKTPLIDLPFSQT
jgi:hypothetical protein